MAPLRKVLETEVLLTDKKWDYHVKSLSSPNESGPQNLIKAISFVSSKTEQRVELRFETAPSNRITVTEKLHQLLAVNVADFRLREPELLPDGTVALAAARESAAYIARMLKTGIALNGVHYHFYGHSNSQLKSRSCLLFAGSKDDISVKIEGLGDFSKIKSVAKKAKRIGLLFSTADAAVEIDPTRCEDIEDVTVDDYNFTDGCGLISENLARSVVQRRNIVFRTYRYLPSCIPDPIPRIQGSINARSEHGCASSSPVQEVHEEVQYYD
jgi:hypothetical protein